MPDINATPDARIHTLYRLQYIQRRRPQLVLGPVIVDRDTDVILLYELLKSRQRLGRGVASDNDGNTCSLAVFELSADVRIFLLREIDSSGSVERDARRGVVRQGGRLPLRVNREMIFDVLRIQGEHVELLHEADHLRATEIAESIAGQTQTEGRCLVSRRRFMSHCKNVARSSECCGNQRSGAKQTTTGEGLFHMRPITHFPAENAVFLTGIRVC